MRLRDGLVLDREGTCAGTFELGERIWELGSHPSCDIAVHSAEVAPRAFLVAPRGGTVWLYDLLRDPGLSRPRVLAIDVPVALGGGYCVVRRKLAVAPGPVHTEPLRVANVGHRATALVQGRGREARAFAIDDRPISVGTDRSNRVVLTDRSVSRFHCRIEPSDRGVFVRDLESTNGTWLDGARARRVELRPGAVLRVGRSSFQIAGEGVEEMHGTKLVASSSAMLAVVADVDRFAPLSWPALILGETGVGKELVARALHERSPRRQGPFVALNGGGLARELIESELFGHERGAFTGAHQAHRGAFEQADGGTLFVDEVAELPADLQTRLLRVLETWTVRRVGSEIARSVDVRLVCATHRDLPALIELGRFRADLYYRIHRLVIEVPPLRHRPDDIEPLASHVLEGVVSELGERELSAEALCRLRAHRWPGNVRELRNALELAAVSSSGGRIEGADLDRALRSWSDAASRPPVDALRRAVAEHGGNLSAAARSLGIPRSTLRDRLNVSASIAPEQSTTL